MYSIYTQYVTVLLVVKDAKMPRLTIPCSTEQEVFISTEEKSPHSSLKVFLFPHTTQMTNHNPTAQPVPRLPHPVKPSPSTRSLWFYCDPHTPTPPRCPVLCQCTPSCLSLTTPSLPFLLFVPFSSFQCNRSSPWLLSELPQGGGAGLFL